MRSIPIASQLPRHGVRVVLILALSLNLFTFTPVPAVQAAAIIQVNSAADSLANDGRCTLREAVIAANRDALEAIVHST